MIVTARKATDEERNSLFKGMRFHNHVFFTKQQILRDKYGEETYHCEEKPIGNTCRRWEMMLQVGTQLKVPFVLYDFHYCRQIPLNEQIVMRIGARNKTESLLVYNYMKRIVAADVEVGETKVNTSYGAYDDFKSALEKVLAEIDVIDSLPDDLRQLHWHTDKEEVAKAIEEC